MRGFELLVSLKRCKAKDDLFPRWRKRSEMMVLPSRRSTVFTMRPLVGHCLDLRQQVYMSCATDWRHPLGYSISALSQQLWRKCVCLKVSALLVITPGQPDCFTRHDVSVPDMIRHGPECLCVWKEMDNFSWPYQGLSLTFSVAGCKVNGYRRNFNRDCESLHRVSCSRASNLQSWTMNGQLSVSDQQALVELVCCYLWVWMDSLRIWTPILDQHSSSQTL